VLAEQILTREARLVQSWKDGEGRELRLYVSVADDPVMVTDEIILRQQGRLWRRVRFVERPSDG
jgi:hypothetical protein